MPVRIPVEIRPVTAAEHAVWLPLWQGYQRFYMTEIASATSDTTWQRFLDPAEPMHAALAWHDGQAIGLVHWIYHRSTWTTGDYCYLQDLFIAKDIRSSGAGRQLIEHVYREAQAHGSSHPQHQHDFLGGIGHRGKGIGAQDGEGLSVGEPLFGVGAGGEGLADQRAA